MKFVTACFGVGEPYERFADENREKANRLGGEAVVSKFPDTGDWWANCRFKPYFIYSCLFTLKKPVFFLDADWVICKLPEFDLQKDMGFREDKQPSDKNKIVSDFAHFWKPTNNAFTFLRRWMEECDRRSVYKGSNADHGALTAVIKGDNWDFCFVNNILMKTVSGDRIRNREKVESGRYKT